jgi:hypothetical protein
MVARAGEARQPMRRRHSIRRGHAKRRTSEEVWNARESPKLARMVGDFVLAHGGHADAGGRSAWTMSSKYGPLRVSVHTPIEGGLSHGNSWSVYMSFQGAVPKHLPDINPYSGKWNLHLSSPGERISAAETFKEWKRMVAPVLEGA